MDKDINYYLAAFEKMKRAIMRGVKDQHKPLLLLAILNLCQQGIIKTELSHAGKLREVREVREKLRDKCPSFTVKNYCLLTSRTTFRVFCALHDSEDLF